MTIEETNKEIYLKLKDIEHFVGTSVSTSNLGIRYIAIHFSEINKETLEGIGDKLIFYTFPIAYEVLSEFTGL